jgi:hypothetical protein
MNIHSADFELYANELTQRGARGSVMFKALCYKPEDRGFEI